MTMPHTEQSIRELMGHGDVRHMIAQVPDDADWVVSNPDVKSSPAAGRYTVSLSWIAQPSIWGAQRHEQYWRREGEARC